MMTSLSKQAIFNETILPKYELIFKKNKNWKFLFINSILNFLSNAYYKVSFKRVFLNFEQITHLVFMVNLTGLNRASTWIKLNPLKSSINFGNDTETINNPIFREQFIFTWI